MKYNKKAFTLIELIVVITIMFILSMMVYAPYQHFQTKQKVRNSAKIVTQTLYEARNLAINWITTGTWNTSIWVLFASWSSHITLFKYPYWDTISDYENSTYELEKKQLEPWVKVSWDNYLLRYVAISGSGMYLKNGSNFYDNELELNVWLGWISSWNLSKKIKYYTKTYVADVQ